MRGKADPESRVRGKSSETDVGQEGILPQRRECLRGWPRRGALIHPLGLPCIRIIHIRNLSLVGKVSRLASQRHSRSREVAEDCGNEEVVHLHWTREKGHVSKTKTAGF